MLNASGLARFLSSLGMGRLSEGVAGKFVGCGFKSAVRVIRLLSAMDMASGTTSTDIQVDDINRTAPMGIKKW
jgi:hypothetical protein